MRNFVLVTATRSTGPVATGSGIRKLKRGVQLRDFVDTYIREEAKLSLYKTYDRDDTITVVATADGSSLSWNFTTFPEDELLSAVSHLTKEELLRDLKELLPLKAELQ